MKTLRTLIKRQKFMVDEQRRIVAAADDVVTRLQRELIALEQQMVDEQKAVGGNMTEAVTYDAFLRQAMKRREQLDKALLAAEKEAAAARDVLKELFAEQKRYEIALEQAEDKEAAELARRDSLQMDEVAQGRWHRGE